jgi:hypothetical protein
MGAGAGEGGPSGEETLAARGATDDAGREGFKDGAAAEEKGHGGK